MLNFHLILEELFNFQPLLGIIWDVWLLFMRLRVHLALVGIFTITGQLQKKKKKT